MSSTHNLYMFWSKNLKKLYTLYIPVLIYKSGVQWGYTLQGLVFQSCYNTVSDRQTYLGIDISRLTVESKLDFSFYEMPYHRVTCSNDGQPDYLLFAYLGYITLSLKC